MERTETKSTQIQAMKRVMIVDDMESSRNVILRYFRGEFEFVIPKNEDEIMTQFREKRPDAILLDRELWNGKRGDDLLEIFRREGGKVLIAIVSGNAVGQDALLAKGADSFFEKPVDLSRLRNFLKSKGLLSGK